MNKDKDTHLFCHRCGCQLHPGKGNFYMVRIEAVADPTPPEFEDIDDIDQADLDAEFASLIEAMEDMSERELMEQVHQRFTLHLCGGCYRKWIENPAGK